MADSKQYPESTHYLSSKPKLFLIEDSEHDIYFMQKKLNNYYEIFVASNLLEARRIFYENDPKFFNIIAFDGTLEAGEDTLELVKEFRPLFKKGIMVAISDHPLKNRKLFEAMKVAPNSINYEVEKFRFIELAIDLVGNIDL